MSDVIIPTDELIFFRGVGQPPTSLDLVVVATPLVFGEVFETKPHPETLATPGAETSLDSRFHPLRCGGPRRMAGETQRSKRPGPSPVVFLWSKWKVSDWVYHIAAWWFTTLLVFFHILGIIIPNGRFLTLAHWNIMGI
jgi:hypothetical protein